MTDQDDRVEVVTDQDDRVDVVTDQDDQDDRVEVVTDQDDQGEVVEEVGDIATWRMLILHRKVHYTIYLQTQYCIPLSLIHI